MPAGLLSPPNHIDPHSFTQSPVGYSANESGFMGATLLLSGILAAVATAPLFDRILVHHLTVTVRALCTISGVGWLALIWAGA